MERCAVKKGFLLILTILLILGCAGCGSAIRTPDAVDGTRIGVLDGSSSERYAALHGTVKAYATPDELWGALKGGSIECILADARQVRTIRKGHLGMRRVKEPLAESYFRIAAALENPDLLERVDAALAALTEDGTLEAIVRGHYGDPEYVYEAELPEDAERTITAVVCRDFPPFSYADAAGGARGIDADVLRAVCAWLGVNCEIAVAEGPELISSVKNGTYQLAAGGITAASEQADWCAMSEPYAVCTQIILTR